MGQLGYLIQLTAKVLRHDLNSRLEKEHFTVTQWAVIKEIERRELLGVQEGEFTAASIARALDMDKPTMSGIVNRLQEKGLIQKQAHPTDKRAQVLHLTEECQHIIPSLTAISEQSVIKALDGFTEEETTTFSNYLQRVMTNLKTEGESS